MTFREWLADKDDNDFVDYTYTDESDYDEFDFVSVKEAKKSERYILDSQVVVGKKIDVEDTYYVNLSK